MDFSKTLELIKSDFKNHAASGFFKAIYVYLFDSRFRLLMNYRLGAFFIVANFPGSNIIARYLRYQQITKRNCDISYKAIIGRNVKFLHPIGIVIGEEAVIGNNVLIYQNVTLGSHGRLGLELQYPTVHDFVTIYAGAKIIGAVSVGRGAIIGANAVVNINVPDGKIAVGIPAKIKG